MLFLSTRLFSGSKMHINFLAMCTFALSRHVLSHPHPPHHHRSRVLLSQRRMGPSSAMPSLMVHSQFDFPTSMNQTAFSVMIFQRKSTSAQRTLHCTRFGALLAHSLLGWIISRYMNDLSWENYCRLSKTRHGLLSISV